MRKAPRAFGDRGEDLAADYLADHGYQLLERNYTCPVGEADVIAERGERLALVEVKTRQDLAAGHPAEAVTARKQARLRRVARFYLQHVVKEERRLAFDVLAVIAPADGPPTFELIQNAF